MSKSFREATCTILEKLCLDRGIADVVTHSSLDYQSHFRGGYRFVLILPEETSAQARSAIDACHELMQKLPDIAHEHWGIDRSYFIAMFTIVARATASDPAASEKQLLSCGKYLPILVRDNPSAKLYALANPADWEHVFA